MKALRIDRYGPVSALALSEVEEPAPRPAEVLVRVRCASLNDWDWALARGKPLVNRLLAGLWRPRKPLILGCDVAGEVVAVGRDVETFAPGDRVFGDLCQSGFGAFAQFVCAPERALAVMPEAMSFAEAAALPQAGILAVQALIDVGDVASRRSLLINGAGGGVGTLAVQIAKQHHLEVTAVDSAAKLETLTSLGADHVIDYAAEDFTAGDKRYELIIDTRTTRSPLRPARVLAVGGTYATVGGSMIRILEALLLAPFLRILSDKHLRVVAQQPNKDLGWLAGQFEAGTLRPVVDGSYPLDRVGDAFERFATARHIGKIIIRVD